MRDGGASSLRRPSAGSTIERRQNSRPSPICRLRLFLARRALDATGPYLTSQSNVVWCGWMEFKPALAHDSEIPLYRQVFGQIASKIRSGELARGERLPATRELAGQLGLNRTTVSAAYEMLEAQGLISGQVGRGSFVTGGAAAGEAASGGVDWGALLERTETSAASLWGGFGKEVVSFVMSRPSRALFPLDEFRATCATVLAREDLADILQLGSPSGYEPLRRHLLADARKQDLAGPGDDLIVTNGCQQALDLIGRVLLRPGDAVAVEDPVYTGLKNLLGGMSARLVGIPVGAEGLEVAQLQRTLERERPRFLVVTSNFQNPTGATMPLAARLGLLEAAGAAGVPVVENDAYGELRYSGDPLPAIKQLDHHGGTVLLRSFSKVSFPGLRVGWALGPKPLLDRLRQAKEAADLHTDQLSQAVLLEFAESGRLEAHRARMLEAGAERLAATLDACRRYLPSGTRWTRPEGGMNVWVRLPEPLDAGELLARAQKEGVSYLPGRYFAVSRQDPGALRLSFAGLPPDQIRAGLAVLGRIVSGELEAASRSFEPAPAMV
jgi:DNA-binding transcriptional MocR family regulator